MSTSTNPAHTSIPVGTWQLAPTHSTLAFHTKAMGFLPVRGTFDEYRGELRVDGDGAAAGTLTIVSETISTGIRKRDDHLRSDDFLAVERHPHLEFTLATLTPAGADGARLTGTLRSLGRELAIDITVQIGLEADRLRLHGDFELDHLAMGLAFKRLPKRVAVSANLLFDPVA